jgi:tetraacyldisaccharide-1-P 4'-kinase
VERLGAIVVGVRSFPDHHAFLPGEWTAAAGVARAAGADLLLATGKDEPKLSCLPPPGIACRFLEVEMELDPGSRDVLDAALDPILGGTRVGM